MKTNNSEIEMFLRYELFGRRWIGYMPPFLHNIVVNRYRRIANKKYRNYMEIIKMLENDVDKNI